MTKEENFLSEVFALNPVVKRDHLPVQWAS